MAPRQLRRHRFLFPAALAGGLLLNALGGAVRAEPSSDSAGAKGAQMFCFMRNNGNDYQVSWDAAYALVKRQGNSLFRTSPEHAAVMISEAVVQNPTAYPDCGRYLGDLFRRPVNPEAPAGGASPTRSNTGLSRS